MLWIYIFDCLFRDFTRVFFSKYQPRLGLPLTRWHAPVEKLIVSMSLELSLQGVYLYTSSVLFERKLFIFVTGILQNYDMSYLNKRLFEVDSQAVREVQKMSFP